MIADSIGWADEVSPDPIQTIKMILSKYEQDQRSPIQNIQSILTKYNDFRKIPRPSSLTSRPVGALAPVLPKPLPSAEPNSPYTLTWHVRKRYIQRFINWNKYDHLDHCNAGFCRKCSSLEAALQRETVATEHEVGKTILERVNRSSEERSYINNTDFMGYLYEQYGYDTRFKFLRDKDAVFVVRLDGSAMVVVTVLSMDYHIGQYITSHAKYSKKKEANYAQYPPANLG